MGVVVACVSLRTQNDLQRNKLNSKVSNEGINQPGFHAATAPFSVEMR